MLLARSDDSSLTEEIVKGQLDSVELGSAQREPGRSELRSARIRSTCKNTTPWSFIASDFTPCSALRGLSSSKEGNLNSFANYL